MSQTIREFIESNGIVARLVISNPEEKDENGRPLEIFIDEAQDLEELIEHGEALDAVFNNVHAVFYAMDGGNVEGWIYDEEIDDEMPEDHFLMELG